ncbi:MAG: hypothetical protein PPFGHCPK_01383 (plasmid) [Spiroplasma endosymbiont of Drosophila atripex]|nr:MAG: hypothetical protein PPFGHCPK_01383 [Spiroplasma endosymbiont of Drosophila atripex]
MSQIKNINNELYIYKYIIHYARVYNYNDETYKWRPVIPIKKVYNSWVVIPLFTEKEKHDKMKNYFLLDNFSDENIYIDLSRIDKIWCNRKNFDKYPIRDKNNNWIKLKKSTINLIKAKQIEYIYN